MNDFSSLSARLSDVEFRWIIRTEFLARPTLQYRRLPGIWAHWEDVPTIAEAESRRYGAIDRALAENDRQSIIPR